MCKKRFFSYEQEAGDCLCKSVKNYILFIKQSTVNRLQITQHSIYILQYCIIITIIIIIITVFSFS